MSCAYWASMGESSLPKRTLPVRRSERSARIFSSPPRASTFFCTTSSAVSACAAPAQNKVATRQILPLMGKTSREQASSQMRPGEGIAPSARRHAVAEDAARRARRREPARPEDRGGALRDRAGRPGAAHVGPHPARVGGIDEDAAGAKLFGEESRHRVEGRFARAVPAWHLVAEREYVVQLQRGIAQPAGELDGLACERAEPARHHHHARPVVQLREERAGEEERAPHL